ncbi:hypothetical protein L208DRAFT_1266289, partial [Tricholoma matsutake]
FLTSKWGNHNCSQSRTNPDIGGTEPDHLGLVYCGPWTGKRLVWTSFLVACKYPSFDLILKRFDKDLTYL